MKSNLAAEVILSLLILLFAYTAVSKLAAPDIFTNNLRQSPLLLRGAGVLAWLVPLTELCIVLLLLFPQTKLLGVYASLFLLFLFTGYLLFMLSTAAHLPCSCGGIISGMSWKAHIFFNSVFMILSGVCIRLEKPKMIPLEMIPSS